MPIYEFCTDDGDVVEVFMSFAEHDRRVKNDTIKLDDGRKAKTFWNSKSLISTVPANYPMVCSAAGVHPGQIKEHTEHLRQMGCGFVEHTKDGDLVFNDKSQRKKVLESLGMFDRNAGPSDPTPKHRTANCKSFR